MNSRLWLTVRAYFPLFRTAGGTVLFCVHGAQRAFGEQAECTQNKTEPAALAAATGNRKGAVAPLQCQGVWGRNAPNNTLNRIPGAQPLVPKSRYMHVFRMFHSITFKSPCWERCRIIQPYWHHLGTLEIKGELKNSCLMKNQNCLFHKSIVSPFGEDISWIHSRTQ